MIEKIVSGGQIGVDRAALDVALDLGMSCGGWCPQGRRAVDGVIPEKYPLKETAARNYNTRTKLNVRDSDGTLILNRGELNGGTAYTVRVADELGKPYLVVNLEDVPDGKEVVAWIRRHDIQVLNVAGPRENKCPGIYREATGLLTAVIAGVNNGPLRRIWVPYCWD